MKILLWIILGVLGLFVLGCGIILIAVIADTETTGTSNTTTQTTAPTTPPHPTPISITAKGLIDAYEANEVAAKATYEDRYMEITGEVGSISESFGIHSVTLNPPGELFNVTSVRCTVEDENVQQIITLQSGQMATMRGFVDGKGVFDVDVRECSVVN